MKILDMLLFAAAIVIGSALYAAGVRVIRRSSRSRVLGTFLLYVSIVVVFLGSSLGPTPAAVAQTGEGVDLSSRPEWQRTQRVWTSLLNMAGMRMTQKSYDELAAQVRDCEADITTLEDGGVLSKPLADHARSSLRGLLARLHPSYREPSREEALALAHARLVTARAALSEVNRGTVRDRFLARRLATDVRDGFVAWKPYSLAERLAATGLSRDEYKAFAAGAVQELADLLLHGYAIRGSTGSHPIEVLAVEGEIACKMPSFEWQELKVRMNLVTAMLVENRSDREVEIRLASGKAIRVAANDVRTGWELEVVYRDLSEAEKEGLGKLVEDLGSAEEQVRNAAGEAILRFGEKARSALQEAAKGSDAALAERAREVLARLGKDDPLALEESFEPGNLDVIPIEEPVPTPEYGVRPLYGAQERYGIRPR